MRGRFGYFFVGSIFASLLTAAVIPLLSYSASAADLGRYGLLRSLSVVIGLAATLGAEHSLLREFNESRDRSALARHALGISATTTVGILAVWALVGRTATGILFDVEPTTPILLSVAIVLAAQINLRVETVILRAEGNGRAYASLQISFALVLLVGLLVAGLTASRLDFAALAALLAVAVGFQFLIGAAAIGVKPQIGNGGRIFSGEQRAMIKFGLPLATSSLMYWGLDVGDRFLVAWLRSPSELGHYTVAASIAVGAAILSQSFNTFWAPIAYEWASEPGGPARIARLNHQLSIAAGATPALALFAAVASRLILPSSYSGITTMVPSLAFGIACFSVSETTVVGLNVARRTGVVAAISAICLGFNLLANLLLISRFGAEGAAATTATSSALLLALRSEGARKLFRPLGARRFLSFPLFGCVFAVVVALAPVGLAGTITLSTSWLLICIVSFIRLTYQRT